MSEARDLHEQFSGTKAVEPQHAFDVGRLSAWLGEHLDGFRGPLDVRQFKGGQSCPTYRLDCPAGRFVLRRKPPGKLLPSAHAVDREFRVLRAVHAAGYPVPCPHVLCEDESVVGTIFFVMDYADGRVFWDPHMPGIDPEERAAVYDALNETLARLHRLDVAKLGLDDFGRPGNYFARQIARWSRQYEASRTESIAEMDRLVEWLPANNPSDDTTVLVHGDYSLHNVLFHPREPRVVAVLDWEISTLGHPLGDLSYNAFIWYAPRFEGGMATLGGSNLAALGIPTEEAYIRTYCERAGRDVPDMSFYRAYTMFRVACIYQGIIGRVRDGTAANPHAMELAVRIRPLAEAAWREARAAGAA